MSTEDSPDGDCGDGGAVDEAGTDSGDVRDRLEREADRAVEQFDESIVDLLSWILDTETRARIYVYLRQHHESTSEEVAEGTGLYPSTVREALAALHEEGTVTREKREASGAGNNPFEYSAMAPSDLVGDVVEDIQDELNTVFNLDRYIGGGPPAADRRSDADAVTITVEDESGGAPNGTVVPGGTGDGERGGDGPSTNGAEASETDVDSADDHGVADGTEGDETDGHEAGD